jgi:hypothetical protein
MNMETARVRVFVIGRQRQRPLKDLTQIDRSRLAVAMASMRAEGGRIIVNEGVDRSRELIEDCRRHETIDVCA